jgi:phosphoribosylaminoimidazole carboxylase PurE protein
MKSKAAKNEAKPLVGILMGSDSDWPTMEKAAQTCAEFEVACEVRVLSAHRNPEETARYARSAARRGLKVIIAGAGAAAHLAGVVASHTSLPVVGVPVESGSLRGMDALLSTVQMPPGVPVAAVGINAARNAALLAIEILALSDGALARKLEAFKGQLATRAREADRNLAKKMKAAS